MTYKKKGHWRSCPTPGCGRRIYWDHGHKPQELIYKKKIYCCERHRNGAEKVERWHAERKKRQNELLRGKKDGTSQQTEPRTHGLTNSHSNLVGWGKDFNGTGRNSPFVRPAKNPQQRSSSMAPPYCCKECGRRSWQVTNMDLVHGGLCVDCYNKRGEHGSK